MEIGSILDSDHKSEYQKSSSFIVPKIELSLVNDVNTGRVRDYTPVILENKENNSKAMNRIDILMMSKESKERKNNNLSNMPMDQLVTFHSHKPSYPKDDSLKVEDLISKFMSDKEIEWQLDLHYKPNIENTDFECQADIPSAEESKEDKELAKWKKAYFQEKQNHKLTKTVLDQALAMSMKLLTEVKSLDVQLYQEQEKNRKFKSWPEMLEDQLKKKPLDAGTTGSPARQNSEEASGSAYSQFIRKSTEEIENIIRKIQFDSDKKKKSAEKPPQAPKAQK